MAEFLEEFDQPSPSTVGFCQQIPSDLFDEISAHTTQAALHDLMNHLEANPEEFYKILRKKKAGNLKLTQFVKVKVMNKFKDDYLEKYFPEEECKKDLENMKKEMVSAYDYAQDGKRTGIRFSRRLAQKRMLIDPLAASTPRPSPVVPSAPPLPPPPPPPPPFSNMSTATISPVGLKRLTSSDLPGTPSGTFYQEHKLVQSIRDIGPRRKLREINEAYRSNNAKKQSCVPAAIDQENIVAARSSLKSTRTAGSPESPYQQSKSRRKDEEKQDENYTLFNMELLRKFHNTRSPSNSPSGNIASMSDSGFES